MDAQTHRWVEGWMDEWMHRWMNRRLDEMAKRTDGIMGSMIKLISLLDQIMNGKVHWP